MLLKQKWKLRKPKEKIYQEQKYSHLRKKRPLCNRLQQRFGTFFFNIHVYLCMGHISACMHFLCIHSCITHIYTFVYAIVFLYSFPLACIYVCVWLAWMCLYWFGLRKCKIRWPIDIIAISFIKFASCLMSLKQSLFVEDVVSWINFFRKLQAKLLSNLTLWDGKNKVMSNFFQIGVKFLPTLLQPNVMTHTCEDMIYAVSIETKIILRCILASFFRKRHINTFHFSGSLFYFERSFCIHVTVLSFLHTCTYIFNI